MSKLNIISMSSILLLITLYHSFENNDADLLRDQSGVIVSLPPGIIIIKFNLISNFFLAS